MKDKPDVRAFLDAGEQESATPAAPQASPSPAAQGAQGVTVTLAPPRQRVQKIFRLRWDISAALKVAAIQESEREDRRVSETEIVERILKKHFGIK